MTQTKQNAGQSLAEQLKAVEKGAPRDAWRSMDNRTRLTELSAGRVEWDTRQLEWVVDYLAKDYGLHHKDGVINKQPPNKGGVYRIYVSGYIAHDKDTVDSLYRAIKLILPRHFRVIPRKNAPAVELACTIEGLEYV